MLSAIAGRSRMWAVALLLLGALVGCSSAGAPSAPPDLVSPPPPVTATAGTVPTEIHIPSLNIHGTEFSQPLGRDANNQLEVPDVHTPHVAGWWKESAIPGEPGTSVIVAHVDGDGKPGLFFRLKDIKPGAFVEVVRSDGKKAVYSVTRVETHPKDRFPTVDFFGQVAGSELHLATCGGEYDPVARSYRDNILVWATFAELKDA